MRRALLGGALAIVLPAVATATPETNFDLTAGLNAGWSSNPYLAQGSHGTATLSGSLAPVFTITTATSSTTISGDATYLKYLSGYGDSRTLDGRLLHSQTFSPHLNGDLSLEATDSTSALLNPFLVTLPVTTGDLGIGTTPGGATTTTPTSTTPVTTINPALPALPTDIIASRQNVRTFAGSGDLSWQPSALYTATFSANAARGIYPGSHHAGVPADVSLSDYWSYGGGVNVGRRFNDRTTVGLTLTANRTLSRLYPDGTSIDPGLSLDQRLNGYWTLHAGVNLILDTLDLKTGHDHSTQAGFNLNLCGTYPHKSLCFNASRETTPSGYGGLQTRLSGSVNGSVQLSNRSSINGTIGYARDESSGAFETNNLSLLQASAGYSRTLTRRLSFNLTAGYQRSSYEHAGNADALTASAGLSISLGRNP